MAIPYNPSSFNSNKTILQAIEELKKYLQENPCYKIYMYNDNYVDGTYVYDKSGVDDPDSIEAYDVIFFTNSYYSKVESVGDSTITVWPAINFTGAEGPQGPAGADGADGTDGANGISITNVAINSSNHLICTLSDGNTIDAGEIPTSSDHTITLLSSSGVLTNEQYAELGYDNSIIKYTINSVPYLFRKESEDATEITFRSIRPHSTDTRIPDIIITKAGQGYQYYDSQITISGTSVKSGTATVGQVLTADGDGFTSWQTPTTPSVEGTAVKSTGETSGKVLTANGSGGASWQTPTGLTKYTANTITPARLWNILMNCKGRVIVSNGSNQRGMLVAGGNGTPTFFVLSEINPLGTGTGDVIIDSVRLTNSGWGTGRKLTIASDGTITSTDLVGTTMFNNGIYVTYWNDSVIN